MFPKPWALGGMFLCRVMTIFGGCDSRKRSRSPGCRINVGMKSPMFFIPQLCMQFPMFYSQVCFSSLFSFKYPRFTFFSNFLNCALTITTFPISVILVILQFLQKVVFHHEVLHLGSGHWLSKLSCTLCPCLQCCDNSHPYWSLHPRRDWRRRQWRW